MWPDHHAIRSLGATLTVLLLAAHCLRAEHLPIRIFTSADGLGSSFVNSIMRDSRGFLWICTRDGLSRFDGAHFVTYQVGDKNAPPGIESILESRKGIYWIVTTGGLYRFDPRVLPPAAENNDRPRLNAEFITDSRFILFEDHNGGLWGGLASGLYHAVETSGKTSFERVTLKSNRDLAVTSLCESRDGSLWIGSYTTLLRRTPDGNEFYYDLPVPPHDAITGLQEDREGRIWVGGVSGIYAVNPESLEDIASGKVAAVRSFNARLEAATHAPVRLPTPGEVIKYAFFKDSRHAKCFYETSDGELWLSDGSVVARFDGTKFEILNSSSIKGATKLAEDSGGNLWLAGSTGLMRVDWHGLVSYGEDDGLRSAAVTTIGESRNGQIYFAGDNFSLTSFDGNTFRSIRAPVSPTAGMLWTATGAFQDHAGEWWIPSTEGLFHFAAVDDAAKLETAHPLDVYTNGNGLRATQAFHVFEDSKGALWISTRDTNPQLWGLTKWDRATRTFYTFTEADGFPSGKTVSAFAEDRFGTLWLGLFDGGILHYAGGRFARVPIDLPEALITAVHADRAGRIWIASPQAGLKILNNPNASQLNFSDY